MLVNADYNRINPLNPVGWFSGLQKQGGGAKTRRAGFPAFAMVCQKAEEHLNRRT